jgi:hypothetical protein
MSSGLCPVTIGILAYNGGGASRLCTPRRSMGTRSKPLCSIGRGKGMGFKIPLPWRERGGRGGVVIQSEPKVDPYRSAGHLFTKRASPQLLAALPPKKQNLRDPIAFIPEVQALSAPGGARALRARIKLSHEFRHGKELEEHSPKHYFCVPRSGILTRYFRFLRFWGRMPKCRLAKSSASPFKKSGNVILGTPWRPWYFNDS